MKPGTSEKEIYTLERQLKREKGIRLTLLIMLGILTFAFMGKQSVTKTIMQPVGSEDESRWVSSDGTSSQQYLKETTQDILDLALVFSPLTAKEKFDSLLLMVSPESYGAIQKHLLRKQERVRENQVSSVFYPEEYKFKLSELQVSVKGVLKTFSGEKPVINEVRTYVIDYNMVGDQVFLNSYLDATGVRDPFSLFKTQKKRDARNEK